MGGWKGAGEGGMGKGGGTGLYRPCQDVLCHCHLSSRLVCQWLARQLLAWLLQRSEKTRGSPCSLVGVSQTLVPGCRVGV